MIRSTGWAKKALRLLLLVACVACFGLQAYECLYKFFGKKTTVGNWLEMVEGLVLPTVAICPGKRKNAPSLQDHYGNETLQDAQGRLNESALNLWWASVTFDADQVVERIWSASGIGPSRQRINFTKQVLDSEMGRCTVINVDHTMASYEVLSVNVNMTMRSKMALYLFEAGGELGLNMNYWPVPVHFEELILGEQYDMTLKQRIISRESSEVSKCSDDANNNYTRCIYDWHRAKYINATKPCRMAVSQIITTTDEKLANLSHCGTYQEHNDMWSVYSKAFSTQESDANTGCIKSCRQVYYDLDVRKNLADDIGNLAIFHLFYTDTNIEVSEEVPLYDFNAMVSAVGGSLGLFLGISIWGSLDFFTDLFFRKSKC